MKHQRGLTLVEMIIYIALVSLISTSLVSLYIQIIRLKSRTVTVQEVNDSVRLAAAKIDFEIRNAVSVLGVGASLSLIPTDSARSPVSFELTNGRIMMHTGATSAYITSNLVTITGFSVSDLSSPDGKYGHLSYSLNGICGADTASVTGSTALRPDNSAPVVTGFILPKTK